MDLKNKNIIVTGGTDGIGLEIVKKLLEKEVNVIIIGRNSAKINDLNVKFYPCDLRHSDEIDSTVKKILKDFPNIHVLINNAGIWHKKGQLDTIPTSIIDDVVNTNLLASIKLTHAFLSVLKNQEESILINISSRSGVVASEGQSVYCASKFGLYGFTETLKIDLKGTSVRVAGVYQGGVNTNMFNKAGEEFTQEKLNSFISPIDLATSIVFMLTQPRHIWLHDLRVESC